MRGTKSTAGGLVAVSLVLAALSILPPPTRSAVNDLELSGKIYMSDGSFLGDTLLWGNAGNNTPFTVWIQHWNGATFVNYSYPSPTVTCDTLSAVVTFGTCGGWYSIHISSADKGIPVPGKWEVGDKYWVQVDLRAIGRLNQNYTSYGTGSYHDADGNGFQGPGEPNEYTPYGEVFNTIGWWSNDNWQQWDIIEPNVDLLPTNASPPAAFGVIFDGTFIPGPLGTAPTVAMAQPYTFEFFITNRGSTMINLTSTARVYDDAAPLTDLQAWGVAPVLAGQTLGPYQYFWTSPSTPTPVTLCAEVDRDDVIAEYNETNNIACAYIPVALPDLVPQPVSVLVNGVDAPGSPWSWFPPAPPCVTVVLDITDTVDIEATVENVAPFDSPPGVTHELIMYNTTACGDPTRTSVFFNSGPLAPLAGGAPSAVQGSPWVNPGVPDIRWVGIEVDANPPGGGNVIEAEETNNTFYIQFVIGGPDLILANLRLDLGAGCVVNVPPNPGPIVINQSVTICAQTTNQGSDTLTNFPLIIYESDASGNMIGTNVVTTVNGVPNGQIRPNAPLLYPISWANPGNYYVTVCTNWGGSYADTLAGLGPAVEVTYLNNCYTIPFVVQGPDLIVTGLTVDSGGGPVPPPLLTIPPPVNPNCVPLTPLMSVTISARARNEGANGTGSTFNMTFSNATSAGVAIPPPFLTYPFLALAPGTTSPQQAQAVWDSTPLSPGTYYILITVDSDDVVLEVSEANSVLFCIQVGGFPDVAVLDLTVQGAVATSPAAVDVITGQVVRLTTRIQNLGPVNTFVYASDFDVVFCEFSPTLQDLQRNVTGSLSPQGQPGDTAGPFSLAYRFNAPGTYEVRIVADLNLTGDDCNQPSGEIRETDDGQAVNNNVFRVTVNVFDLLPAPDVRVATSGTTVVLTWGAVAGASAYFVYGGTSPEGIDFAAARGNTTTTTFTDANALTADEMYYVVRTADSHGWRGPSSAVVGVFTHAFPEGYSTFSLPLLPFPGTSNAVSYWTGELLADVHDTIYEWNTTRGSYVGHPKGLNDLAPNVENFAVRFGAGYEIYRTTSLVYRFVGYPSTTIAYLSGDNNDPRVGTAPAFRDGLDATVTTSEVQLSWVSAADASADEQIAEYRVFKSSVRSSFDFSTPAATTTGLNWSEARGTCAAALCESYYLVQAVNTAGRGGSTTFAVAVITFGLSAGYNHVGLPLRPEVAWNAADLLANLAADSVAFAMRSEDWVGHAKLMPLSLDNFAVNPAFGYTIYVQTPGTVTLVGR